ncbi:conserved hypothetical protein [Perkinsus marinus ATCC 50983]|uniref:Sugar phosphate transporter domain-containing protein n=1 Tax=Perkinsus marinus (strain ATCC 50983 / TXsc) TaxID=423536 RepID=C5LSU2_PERM5|nr:conserved hypothetical protein [Perkinsus marinus ATCC 50983]EER00333.1 conserved hypothetical protein [Perkinsus marinus ATCC 50983]|eukprot:XP_002767615.1 conserved hypothetical protein [Perkinsus marinus ATCC 50983]
MTAIPPSPNQTLPRQLQPQHVDGLHNDLERLPPPAANDQLPDLEYAGLYEHQQPLKEPIEQHRKGQFTAVSAGSGGVLLLFLYTFLDANKAVMVYWSYSARSPDERYSAGSMVLAENVLSLVASLGISLACLGSKQCHSMWSTRYFLRLIPSALSFTMARILGLRALQYIDAGTLKVMSQAVLPTNAILSSLLMGTKYSVIQWQCLLLVFVTTAAFYEIRVFEERQFATISQGLPLFLATLTFTSIGAVYSEKCIKAGGDVPFYYQKVPQ